MKTLVCLPTKNEKINIEKMINDIRLLYLDLIVVDESSTDGTIQLAKSLGVDVYQRDGSGKGYGVQKALELASKLRYDNIVLIDCDNSYPTESIPRLLNYLSGYDMVVGARSMEDIQFSHRLVNMLHTGSINLLFGTKLKDINSGLRAFKVERFKGKLNAKGFDIEAEITTKAVKNNLKIKEVPIEYKRRLGKSKIRLWDTFRILKRILLERLIK